MTSWKKNVMIFFWTVALFISEFSCFSPTTLAKWETVNTDHLRELPLCPVVTSTGLLSRLLLHKDTVGMRRKKVVPTGT